MFRTVIDIPTSFHIKHDQKIMTMGSCFSDCMGQRLSENKFNVLNNPFGTQYHPLSIHRLLKYTLDLSSPSETELVEHDGIWSHYDMHSSVSDPGKSIVWKQIQSTLQQVKDYFSNTDVVIITYGTALEYILKENGYHVSNCHKKPAALFKRKLRDLNEIVCDFNSIIKHIHQKRPELKIILTVSPVRHIRDSLQLNQLSKSMLRVATHQMTQQENVYYFPSYEIMMDDLRDYRFYKSDMIHPTKQAEGYIWEEFSKAHFPPGTQEILKRWRKVKKSMDHRPFHNKSESYKRFLRGLLSDMHDLNKDLPLHSEIKWVDNRIAEIDAI